MTDVSETPQDEQQKQESVDTPAEAKKAEHMIPKGRFDEVNERAKQLAEELEKLRNERQQQQRATLEEQNQFQELYQQTQAELDQLKDIQEKADRYRQSLQATNEARIAQIPQEKHHLIPEYDDPVLLGAWLDRALPDLVEAPKPRAPKLDGGSGSGGEAAIPLSATHEQLANIALEYGYPVDKERIARFAKNQPPTSSGE